MAEIQDKITVGEVCILELSEDPRNSGGTDAPVGSLAIQQGSDDARWFRKFGPLVSDWRPINHEKFNAVRTTSQTTTSTTFQNYLSGSFDIPFDGDYKVTVAYIWNHDSNTNDFEAELEVDLVRAWLHKQEPKDSAGGDPSGSTQRYLASHTIVISALTAGNHSFDLNFRTDTGGHESTIFQGVILVEEVE